MLRLMIRTILQKSIQIF